MQNAEVQKQTNDLVVDPMKNTPSVFTRCFRLLNFCLLPFAFCILAACSRAPQTAAELYDKMPRRFAGEVRIQGETGTRTLIITVLDLQPRDAHRLGFKRIAYEVSGANESPLKGEAAITGTISAPGGEIVLEDASGAGGGDAVKAGSFQGKLSGNLKSVDAKWKTGFDQSISFEGEAAR